MRNHTSREHQTDPEQAGRAHEAKTFVVATLVASARGQRLKSLLQTCLWTLALPLLATAWLPFLAEAQSPGEKPLFALCLAAAAIWRECRGAVWRGHGL